MPSKEYRDAHWKECSERSKRYYIKNKDKIKVRRREKYLAKMRENPNFAKEDWQSRDPIKRKARAKARNEVKIKGLCQICKTNPAEVRHHKDYSKPLEVQLLCNDCHNKLHKGKDENLNPAIRKGCTYEDVCLAEQGIKKGCSLEQIQKARMLFLRNNLKEPNTIKIHPKTIRKLISELMPIQSKIDTIFGLKIIEDLKIAEDYCLIYFEEEKKGCVSEEGK